jgi:hypothetical protein
MYTIPMTRESFLVILGALVILSPFAGLPLSWLEWILPILGVIVIILGISLRRDRAARESQVSE